jgi:ribosomal protein S12 methylthiotransferase
MAANTFYILSLGCAKNTVDSDSMAALLAQHGMRLVRKPERASVLIVNTCGFIGPARAESLDALQTLAAGKRAGQTLIAAGCFAQRSSAEIQREVPGVDAVLGTRRWMDIFAIVDGLRRGESRSIQNASLQAPSIGGDEQGVLRASIAGASAYLKIADGCDRPCAFCAIPAIKGPLVSRPAARIVAEARELESRGVRELILLAQDTTAFGHDRGESDGLAVLLAALANAAPRIDWIRVMYSFPGAISENLVDCLAAHPQILPYLDIPLQHAHPNVLRRMLRPSNMDEVRRTIERMRTRLPDLAVRSTFLVGFPGETEQEFQTLLDFVAEIRFDRVGCFPFYCEEGTVAAALPGQIPDAVKEERHARLMEMQQNISLEKNRGWIGRSLSVLVEGREKQLAIGRSFRDAPEVDGVVFVEGDARPGELIRVHITGALPYDLIGAMDMNTPTR